MRIKEFNKEVLYVDGDLGDVCADDIALLKKKALMNERKRIRLCTHKDINDPLHEMLIIHARGTYVRPHRHLSKSESLHVIEGVVDIVLFNEQGDITEIIPMGDYASGRKFFFRMSASYYHTLIVRSDFLVFHETTKGPFQGSDTIFAPWAPQENDGAAVESYSKKLAGLISSHSMAGRNT